MTCSSRSRDLCAVLLTLPLVAPYVPLAWSAWSGAPAISPAWDAKAQSTFWSSVLLCALVCLLALGIAAATLLLLWLAKSKALRLALHLCLLLLFALSPVIQMAGWRNYGLLPPLVPLVAATLVLSWKYFPLLVWLALAGLHLQDAAAFEAARTIADRGLPLARLVLPMLAPALAGGTAVVAALVFLEAEVPPMLGLDVYASDYMGRLAVDASASGALLGGVPFLVVAIAVVVVFAVNIGHVGRAGSGGGGLAALDACRRGASAATPLVVVTILVFLAPVLALIPRAVTGGIAQAGTSDLAALQTSCLLGIAAALAATVFSYVLADCLMSGARVVRVMLLASIGVCMFVPGTLTGLAMAQLATSPGLGALSDGDLPLIATHTLRAAPLGALLLFGLRWMEPAALREELQLTGAPWLALQRFVRLPAYWPGVVTIFGLLLVLALSELSSTILVVAPGTETVILRLYNLMHYGAADAVAFLALLQALLTVTIVVAVFFAARRGLHVANRAA